MIRRAGLLRKQYIFRGNKIKSYYAPSVGPPLTDLPHPPSVIYTNDFSAPSLSYTLFPRLRTQFVDDYSAATASETTTECWNYRFSPSRPGDDCTKRNKTSSSSYIYILNNGILLSNHPIRSSTRTRCLVATRSFIVLHPINVVVRGKAVSHRDNAQTIIVSR